MGQIQPDVRPDTKKPARQLVELKEEVGRRPARARVPTERALKTCDFRARHTAGASFDLDGGGVPDESVKRAQCILEGHESKRYTGSAARTGAPWPAQDQSAAQDASTRRDRSRWGLLAEPRAGRVQRRLERRRTLSRGTNAPLDSARLATPRPIMPYLSALPLLVTNEILTGQNVQTRGNPRTKFSICRTIIDVPVFSPFPIHGSSPGSTGPGSSRSLSASHRRKTMAPAQGLLLQLAVVIAMLVAHQLATHQK